ncbi:uncharacterized protein LY79DRAFT_570670, partial [Colletotrichum navitas]
MDLIYLIFCVRTCPYLPLLVCLFVCLLTCPVMGKKSPAPTCQGIETRVSHKMKNCLLAWFETRSSVAKRCPHTHRYPSTSIHLPALLAAACMHAGIAIQGDVGKDAGGVMRNRCVSRSRVSVHRHLPSLQCS